jgi:hypothetical protein
MPLRVRRLLQCLSLILALAPVAVIAANWHAQLEDGRSISVDADTNRAVIDSGSARGTPLWDGVHRLSDGSVITVRSGLMVPNEPLLAVRGGQEASPPSPQGPLHGDDSCDALVLLTCGMDGECGATEACELARQLRGMQWEDRAGSPAEARAWAQERCRAGLADPASFPNCASAIEVPADPCGKLVQRACGKNARCERSEACQLAKELSGLEARAVTEGVPDHAENTRQQCFKILQDHAFFPPCR